LRHHREAAAGPARAASIVALSASRLVWPAIEFTSAVTRSICSTALVNPSALVAAISAQRLASATTLEALTA
jgi:hypothetical protein